VPLLIVVVSLLTACGSGESSPSAPEWMRHVCSDYAEWYASSRRIREASLAARGTYRSREEVKNATVRYFADLTAVTDDLIEDWESAGVPDIAEGQAVADFFVRFAHRLRSAFEEGRDKARDISIGDPAAFVRGVQALDTTTGRVKSTLKEGFPEIRSDKLNQAFRENETCRRHTPRYQGRAEAKAPRVRRR
jgi:hypothetical protein